MGDDEKDALVLVGQGYVAKRVNTSTDMDTSELCILRSF